MDGDDDKLWFEGYQTGYYDGVIKSIEINYLPPAKLGEELTVQTHVTKKTNARMIFDQEIFNTKTSEIICNGVVEVCLVNAVTKKPKPFPNDLLLIFDRG